MDVQLWQRKCFVQIQSAFDAIPNSTGTATVAGADALLVTDLQLDAMQNEIERPDVPGTLDDVPSQGGRRLASATVKLSMAGNGAAGVAPDVGKLLQAAFGKTAAVVSSTSVTYAIDDNIYYLSIYQFNGPANATQFVIFNAVIVSLEVTLGGDVPMLSFQIEGGWVYDNDQAADGTTPTLAKGGLTAFPAEPATPVVNGTHPKGFEITGTIDGTAYSTVQSVTIRLDFGRELRKDTNNEFARAASNGRRRVSLSFSITDDDAGTTRTLKQKAIKRTAINTSFVVGTVAGNIWTWTVLGVILAKPKYGAAGIRRKIDFTGSRAFPSALNAKDQCALVIT